MRRGSPSSSFRRTVRFAYAFLPPFLAAAASALARNSASPPDALILSTASFDIFSVIWCCHLLGRSKSNHVQLIQGYALSLSSFSIRISNMVYVPIACRFANCVPAFAPNLFSWHVPSSVFRPKSFFHSMSSVSIALFCEAIILSSNCSMCHVVCRPAVP
jgi:hypothetical protein